MVNTNILKVDNMELIFITNDPIVAGGAEVCGIDRVMVDMEIIGKEKRQGHLSTVISKHTLEDVSKIRNVIKKTKLLVRVNPIHENSKSEIDEVINLGADIIMLPMFTTPKEVKTFVSLINGRTVVNLLLETPQALVRIDNILKIDGIDEIHIGLNDLHLGMELKFMFEILSGGIVEYLSKKITSRGIRFGFGGIGRLKEGLPLNPRLILSEHYRLKSEMVILSRDFHGYSNNPKNSITKIDLEMEVDKIRAYWKSLQLLQDVDLERNKSSLINTINQICLNY
jgi:hypothetical protein